MMHARRHHSSVAGVVVWAALVAVGCGSGRKADGAACTSALECSSGFCLDESATSRVCARRCGADSECGEGRLCGRFDFRGRDDSGVPVGEDIDIARVCRSPLNRRCSEGCEPGEVCVGGEGTQGVCAVRCTSNVTCGGRDCVRVGCEQVCAPPCDSLTECGRTQSCDLARHDNAGHGQCIFIGGEGPLPDAGCPAMP